MAESRKFNRFLRVSEQFYRTLLKLYPADHQARYGQAMAQTFRDMLQERYTRNGAFAVIRLWGEMLVDVAVSAAVEHRREWRTWMSKRSVIVLCLAFALAVFTGYVNITATEVQAPMACILLFSFLAGLMQPKGAWRWALLMGLSIPISTFVGLAVNFNFPDAPPHFPITLVILVIPALVAAYIGSFSSRVVSGMRQAM